MGQLDMTYSDPDSLPYDTGLKCICHDGIMAALLYPFSFHCLFSPVCFPACFSPALCLSVCWWAWLLPAGGDMWRSSPIIPSV